MIQNYHLTIDLRMFHASGIGTYIQNIVPLVISGHPDIKFNLLGDADNLYRYNWALRDNVRIIDCRIPIYSVSEQFGILEKIPKETTLFWSPHFNMPLFYRGNLLVTIYDVFHLAMPKLVGGLHKRLYAKALFNAVRRKAEAIITISQFTKNELIRLTGTGSQEIFPINLGVNDSWFKIESGKSPYPKPFLLYVGNVKPHKNLGNLVRAFGLLTDKIPHDLVIIGKTEGFITGDKNLKEESAKCKGRVTFPGFVEEEVLKNYFKHADAFIFPSFYEGFGLPPLEAMAAGCPVLVSNLASLPEVCSDAALYCDPHIVKDIADKILELLSNQSLRETLRSKGVKRAKKFTWEKCAKETNEVIDRILREL